MKLYVWRGANVLKNYRTGYAIAYTFDIKYARLVLEAQIRMEYDFLDEEDIQDKLEFLKNEPEIFGELSPAYFIIEGSE